MCFIIMASSPSCTCNIPKPYAGDFRHFESRLLVASRFKTSLVLVDDKKYRWLYYVIYVVLPLTLHIVTIIVIHEVGIPMHQSLLRKCPTGF